MVNGTKDTSATTAAPEKKKKSKKEKEAADESGLPPIKKPLSAYMLFNNHRRPVIKEEYPGKYLLPS